MAVTIQQFISKVLVIKALNPKRREPGDGSDGYCDCIGLVIGAIRRCGLRWTGIHGCNWAARKEAVNFRPIKSVSDLELGDVVLKGRAPGAKGYALPARYKQGNQYYNGDLTDYYHAGVVTSLNPFNITHMSSKIMVDTKLGKWNYAMRVKPLVNAGAYSNDETPTIINVPSSGTQAKVTAPSGSTVNMRRTPQLSGALIMRVPIDTIVNIIQPGEEWCKISYGSKTGYMMAKFLEVI